MVYETIEELSGQYPELAAFQSTGLERSAALKKDLDWMSKEYGFQIPPPGTQYSDHGVLEFDLPMKRLKQERFPEPTFS